MNIKALKTNLRKAGFELAARHLEFRDIPGRVMERGGLVVLLDVRVPDEKRKAPEYEARLDDGQVIADEHGHYLERAPAPRGVRASGLRSEAMEHCTFRASSTTMDALVEQFPGMKRATSVRVALNRQLGLPDDA